MSDKGRDTSRTEADALLTSRQTQGGMLMTFSLKNRGGTERNTNGSISVVTSKPADSLLNFPTDQSDFIQKAWRQQLSFCVIQQHSYSHVF